MASGKHIFIITSVQFQFTVASGKPQESKDSGQLKSTMASVISISPSPQHPNAH
jgi:hypothetical protein